MLSARHPRVWTVASVSIFLLITVILMVNFLLIEKCTPPEIERQCPTNSVVIQTHNVKEVSSSQLDKKSNNHELSTVFPPTLPFLEQAQLFLDGSIVVNTVAALTESKAHRSVVFADFHLLYQNVLLQKLYNVRWSGSDWVISIGYGREEMQCIVTLGKKKCDQEWKDTPVPDAFIMPYCASNFRHFIIDCLPMLWWYLRLKEVLPTNHSIPVLTTKKLLPFSYEMMEMLGVTNTGIIQKGTLFSNVYIPSRTSYTAYKGTSPGFLEVIGLIRKKGLPQVESKQSTKKRIYLRRKDPATGSGRVLVNEEEFNNELVKLGFEEMVGSKLSVAEKFTFFSDVEVLLLEAGAGEVNFVFMQPNSTVIEVAHPCYAPVTTDADRYRALSIRGVEITDCSQLVEPIQDPCNNNPWKMDVPRAIAIIKETLHSSD
mmetsp:Transcript_21141/g.54954  ORF Transcript_21141/g.54954 Transcript_21141/m.54954 type:complete len:429 (-) Transcript_21141:2199-3485(-)